MTGIMKVDGIGYEPTDIEAVRIELDKLRSSAMNQWPDTIDICLMLSHAIAQLAYFKEARERNLC